MKIAILTQPLSGNYGGILQNYALQIILKRMGHKPYTLHYYKRSVPISLMLEWIKYIIKCVIRHPNRIYRPTFTLKNIVLNRYNGVAPFIQKYITTTYPMRAINRRVAEVYGFDAYIVGSDQTWRPMYNRGDRLNYMFLSFLKDVNKTKKISYAASFGVDNWEYSEEQTAVCQRLIEKFDSISVREASGVDLCKNYLDVQAEHVLDPTLLLSADDYRSLIKGKDFSFRGEVCAYILDMTDEKRKLIDNFCNRNKLRWFQIGKHLKNGDVPSVESWIAGFDNAKYVITDSFHGSVFSIIFNKPFISIGNDARGMSRFNSLLGLFSLEDRLVSSSENIESITTPNWDFVNKTLSKWQERSINYLKSNLK